VTEREWWQCATEIQARWPNREIPRESIAIWFDDLREFEVERVKAAIRSLYRDEREWPPNGAQIRGRIGELGSDDPDEGEAWRLVKSALMKHGVYDWPAFYSALERRSPALAVAARRYGFEPDGYLTEQEGIVRAQFRDIYRGVRSERAERDATEGLPTAGLTRLERFDDERKGLRRLEAGRVLPGSTEIRIHKRTTEANDDGGTAA